MPRTWLTWDTWDTRDAWNVTNVRYLRYLRYLRYWNMIRREWMLHALTSTHIWHSRTWPEGRNRCMHSRRYIPDILERDQKKENAACTHVGAYLTYLCVRESTWRKKYLTSPLIRMNGTHICVGKNAWGTWLVVTYATLPTCLSWHKSCQSSSWGQTVCSWKMSYGELWELRTTSICK